jgi:hypothetical protein
MHLKVFLKLKKNLKPSLLGKKNKNPKNPKKTKTQKNHWAGFFLNRVFSNPGFKGSY